MLGWLRAEAARGLDLAQLGLDAGHVGRAHAQELLLGRGEGFQLPIRVFVHGDRAHTRHDRHLGLDHRHREQGGRGPRHPVAERLGMAELAPGRLEERLEPREHARGLGGVHRGHARGEGIPTRIVPRIDDAPTALGHDRERRLRGQEGKVRAGTVARGHVVDHRRQLADQLLGAQPEGQLRMARESLGQVTDEVVAAIQRGDGRRGVDGGRGRARGRAGRGRRLGGRGVPEEQHEDGGDASGGAAFVPSRSKSSRSVMARAPWTAYPDFGTEWAPRDGAGSR